jgi:hypothetical protein
MALDQATLNSQIKILTLIFFWLDSILKNYSYFNLLEGRQSGLKLPKLQDYWFCWDQPFIILNQLDGFQDQRVKLDDSPHFEIVLSNLQSFA